MAHIENCYLRIALICGMKRASYILIQIIFWAVVWYLMSLNQRNTSQFILDTVPTFLFQIGAIIFATYYLIPRFLFTKKYLYFLAISVPLLLIFAYLSSLFINPINPEDIRPMGPRRPSPVLLHFLAIALAFIFNILIETFIYVQEKEKMIAFAKAELLENELKMLKMQINPHFLFNALNNIYALSVTNSDKTQESISTLSEMLRYVIYDCERPKVTLQKEVEYIENYIALFKLKSSKPFNISFENNVTKAGMFVAPMLFIPYIENAFKHSGIEKGEERFINIALTTSDNQIEFIVENSIPETPQHIDGVGGIGLQNVEKRLNIYYPGKHSLHIETTPNYSVHLKVTVQ